MTEIEQEKNNSVDTSQQSSEQIAKRLKDFIKEKNISQAAFAKGCGISKDKLSKALNNKVALTVNEAIKISETYKISLDYLLLGNSAAKNPYETVYSLLTQHISPNLSPYPPEQSSDGDSYLIRTLKVSAEFFEYLRGIWDLQRSTATENVKKQWKETIEEEFKKKIDDTPDMEHGAEYAAIPLKYAQNPHIFKDLNIYPENHD